MNFMNGGSQKLAENQEFVMHLSEKKINLVIEQSTFGFHSIQTLFSYPKKNLCVGAHKNHQLT